MDAQTSLGGCFSPGGFGGVVYGVNAAQTQAMILETAYATGFDEITYGNEQRRLLVTESSNASPPWFTTGTVPTVTLNVCMLIA